MKRWIQGVIGILLTQGVLLMGEEELTPKQVLDQLTQGNQRFMRGKMRNIDALEKARHTTVQEQQPMAAILTCSDSRVPVEIVFDQGIGDVFVVRNAGNVVSSIQTESILYSVLYLGAKVVLIMGHQNCGAVKAVMEGKDGDIPTIAHEIHPAVEEAKHSKNPSLQEAIIDNVYHSVDILRAHPTLKELIKEEKLIIRGAYYQFTTGEVQLLSPL